MNWAIHQSRVVQQILQFGQLLDINTTFHNNSFPKKIGIFNTIIQRKLLPLRLKSIPTPRRHHEMAIGIKYFLVRDTFADTLSRILLADEFC